jgi:hypothetical protein
MLCQHGLLGGKKRATPVGYVGETVHVWGEEGTSKIYLQ